MKLDLPALRELLDRATSGASRDAPRRKLVAAAIAALPRLLAIAEAAAELERAVVVGCIGVARPEDLSDVCKRRIAQAIIGVMDAVDP